MKLNRVLLLIMVFVIAAAGTAFGYSAYEYLRAKKMDVSVNGEAIAGSGYLAQINRKDVAMADVQSLLNATGGYMRVDEKTGKMDIFNPNVQLVLMWSESRAKGLVYSHTVRKDQPLNVRLTATVDSVFDDIEFVRFSILDPSGEEVLQVEDDKSVKTLKENTTHIRNDFLFTFDKKGTYTVEFSVKPKGSDQFYRVGQTKIESVD